MKLGEKVKPYWDSTVKATSNLREKVRPYWDSTVEFCKDLKTPLQALGFTVSITTLGLIVGRGYQRGIDQLLKGNPEVANLVELEGELEQLNKYTPQQALAISFENPTLADHYKGLFEEQTKLLSKTQNRIDLEKLEVLRGDKYWMGSVPGGFGGITTGILIPFVGFLAYRRQRRSKAEQSQRANI